MNRVRLFNNWYRFKIGSCKKCAFFDKPCYDMFICGAGTHHCYQLVVKKGEHRLPKYTETEKTGG